MKRIGITAGIGAGKSEVLRYLEENYGAVIVEADKIGHEIMDDVQVIRRISDTFGSGILTDGRIDREILGRICFEDKEKLVKLSGILHPVIKQEILLRLKRAELEEKELFVVEAALLIEAGYKEFLDSLWYISCSKEIRIDRLIKNRGLSYEKCLNIIDKQLSDDDFMKECDVVVDNSGTVEHLHKNIDRILTEVMGD